MTPAEFYARQRRAEHMFDARANEAACEEYLDRLWYECGYYDLFGFDRHGVTYVTDISEAGERAAEDAMAWAAWERSVEIGRLVEKGMRR